MKVSIIGAGFSGLTQAYFLTKKNIEVEIFEAQPQPGGMIATKFMEQGLVETAANGVWNSKQFEQLQKDLNLPLAPRKPERKYRYIFRDQASRWPLSAGESTVLAFRIFTRWITRSLKPKVDETIDGWGDRIGGKSFTKYLLAPALQGIYAGDAKRMSAELILGRFFGGQKSKRSTPKGTISPDRGMGQLITELTAWLKSRGVQFHFGKEAKLSQGRTVIATSAWQASEILKEHAPEVASRLAKVESLPLISATLFFQQPPEKNRGFGCLFPAAEKFNSLGVLFNTDIFERRGRGRSETWILGGALHPEILNESDEQILALIADDRVRLFCEFSRPTNFSIQRWHKALPHYTVEWKHTIEKLKLPKNIFLTGNYLGCIGLSRILDLNAELAEKIAGET